MNARNTAAAGTGRVPASLQQQVARQVELDAAQEGRPAPPSEISDRLLGLQDSIELLSVSIAKLAGRLAPVLRALPPQSKGESEPAGSPLGAELGMLIAKVRAIESGVADIHEALAL